MSLDSICRRKPAESQIRPPSQAAAVQGAVGKEWSRQPVNAVDVVICCLFFVGSFSEFGLPVSAELQTPTVTQAKRPRYD